MYLVMYKDKTTLVQTGAEYISDATFATRYSLVAGGADKAEAGRFLYNNQIIDFEHI